MSKYSLPVDGYSEQQNTVYQYLGCFFHSCDKCITNRNSDGSLEVMHPLRNIPHEDIREETKNNKKRLEEEGFCAVEMRECELLKIRKQPKVSCFLKTLKSVKARLQPFTVLFSFSAILVCFIDAQIHSCFREKMSRFERQ